MRTKVFDSTFVLFAFFVVTLLASVVGWSPDQPTGPTEGLLFNAA